MSHTFQCGDLVAPSVDTLLPLNDLYPHHFCICDCKDSTATAYVPYRIYAGDTVIMKMTDSGYALIPEDVAGEGKYNLTNLDTGFASATEYAEYKGWYCYGRDGWCPGYTAKPFSPCTISGGVRLGWMKCDAGYGQELGNDVWGSDSRTATTDHVVVRSRNAYEYVEFTTDTPLISSDQLVWTAGNDPGYPLKYSAVEGKINTYRVEAYPGYGGVFGLAASQGGYGSFYIWISVGGGIIGSSMTGWVPAYRFVPGDRYTPITRGVTITLKFTGRYGNYR